MPKGVERGLPDPMVSIGYQNEGLMNYNLRRFAGCPEDD